jgi:hypothetical protein
MLKKFENLTGIIFRHNLNRLLNIKNLHEGETCYLIGNGPSLKNYDLTKFDDYYSLGCNWIVFHKDVDKIKMKYVLDIDPYYSWNFLTKTRNYVVNDFSKVDPNLIEKYRAESDRLNFVRFEHILGKLNFKKYKNCYFINGQKAFSRLRKNTKLQALEEKYLLVSGALRFQILIAVYMGFSRVILVGHDHLDKYSAKGHWYENYNAKKFYNLNEDWNNEFLRKMRQVIQIDQITEGESRLEFLNTFTYESYTGIKSKYNSNLSLLKEDFVEYLKTQKMYKII